MRYRLVHSQSQKGTLLVSDIDSGLPNEEFGMYRKLPVYLPYYKTYFVTDSIGMSAVEQDISVPGFIDLVPSDKVKLSVDRGVIKGLADKGLLSVVEIPTGAIAAPTISSATFDDDADATSATDDGLVTITGTNFVSYSPDMTTITLEHDGPGEITLDAGDAGVTISATEIKITAAAHGFGVAPLTNLTATVVANGQTVSLAVAAV